MQTTPAATSSVESSEQIAHRLTGMSRDQFWNVYTEFEWPEALSGERYCMPAELISIHGTELWESLDEAARLKLSLYECGNLFSLTLQGERPLVAGLSDRLYSKRLSEAATEYMHHFIDEENKHMVMFGLFNHKYVGKVYPEKKIVIPGQREYAKGEEEISFYCKVLVVEEVGDYYNIRMMVNDEIEPIAKQISWVHHRDESRHLAFGRQHLQELAAKYIPEWSDEEKARFQTWLVQYLKSSWNDFYNPSMYKDAGLEKPYEVRKMALAHPATKAFREKATKKLSGYFVRAGILDAAPEL